ncbi:HAMP domain-containing protein [Candidatus Peregrinibacteria bacterium]|nr:HAMP domain-containing protein [Candidatus Peregrinibacteria bacterium]
MPINFKNILGNTFSVLRPSTWKTLSMVAKVILVTVALILGAILAGGISAYLVAKSYLEGEITFTGRQLVSSLSSSITTLINKEGGEEELQVALNKLVSQDNEGRIEDAYILDKSFVILAASSREMIRTKYTGPLKLETMTGLTTFAKSNATIVAAPVQWGKTDPVVLGYVVFEFSSSTIDKALNRIILWFALIFLVAVALASVITWLVLKGLLKPVVNLGQAAQALANGDIDYPIEESKGHDEIAAATNSFLAMREAQKVFVRFSNPALVRKIQKGVAPDKAEEVKLTIGFGDGVKFTNWSSAHTAPEISEMLTDYFTIAGRLIDDHNGIIEKFIGDAVMSYFGLDAVEGTRVHARNAIKAKIAIQHALAVTSWSFKKFHSRLPLKFRFGLATGKCVVGPIGAKGVKLDYTIIGSTVNLASRLEGTAEPGGLSIDNFTFQNAGGEEFLKAKEPTPVQIKGFDTPIPIYSVIGLQDATEEERLRILIRKFFETREVLDVLKLNTNQVHLLHTEVERRISEPLSLPVK